MFTDDVAVVCAVADTKSIHQKAAAPHPPVNVQSSSPDMDRQRFESNANTANSAPASSPDSPAVDVFPKYDDVRSNALDIDADISVRDVQSAEGLGAVMVEHVRRKTGLSHSQSQLAVATVLNLLAEHVPTTERLVTAILDDVQHQHVCVLFRLLSLSSSVFMFLNAINCIN